MITPNSYLSTISTQKRVMLIIELSTFFNFRQPGITVLWYQVFSTARAALMSKLQTIQSALRVSVGSGQSAY